MSCECEKVKELIQTWLDKQGHDSCWYYPDIFNQIADELNIKRTIPSLRPSLEEFKKGCDKYAYDFYLNDS